MRHLSRFAALLLALAVFLLPLAPVLAAPLEGIIYEVFVRAFADSDGDGIGDIKGLISKLDYIEGLGAQALWLMPIFPSPSYHGYDVSDYRGINSQYGSMADFEALLAAAHLRGIKVLLDIPFNHTSSQHPWFQQSRDKASPYRQWYHWVDAHNTAIHLEQVVWDSKPWKKAGDSYYYALFWEGMPDLNFNHAAVVQETVDIAKYWLHKGVDGFRLDATSHIYAQGERGPKQEMAQSALYWQAFEAAVKADYPDAYLVGEAWEASQDRVQFLEGMDAVVNFDVGDKLIPLLKQGGSGAAYVQGLEKIYAAYQAKAPGHRDAPFLSNHDQVRVFAALGYRQDKAALAARLLLTLPGNPIIYYGEEIGMAGAKPDEELRTPMLWGGDDPMTTKWHSSRYNKRTLPVAAQDTDPDSLLNVYRQAAALRRAKPALHSGTFTPYVADNPIPIAFVMQAEGQRLLVLHNPSGTAQQLTVPQEGQVSLAPYASLLLELSEDSL